MYQTETKPVRGGPPPPPSVSVNTDDPADPWSIKGTFFFGGLLILFWSLVFVYKDDGVVSDIFSGFFFWIGVSAIVQSIWPWARGTDSTFLKRFVIDGFGIFLVYCLIIYFRNLPSW